jgi:hypothetical protein
MGAKIWLSFTVVALFCADVTHAADDWKAGVAEVAITPEHLMWMSGYGARDHRAEGKLHDLHCKTLVIEPTGGEPLVLITLDLVGIDHPTSAEVCRRLEAKHGLKRKQIAINTSHTHCGPVTGTTLLSMYFFGDEDYRLVADYTEQLKNQIVACVDQAMAARGPCRVTYGTGTCDFAVNRRENKEADIERLRAKGFPLKGPFDHDVPVLAIHDADGKLKAVTFGYACHATTLSFYQWCADYPGFAYYELEKRHPGAVALFWAGCGADQNPLPRRTVELAEQYGKRLADSVDAVLAGGSMKPLAPKVDASYDEIPLDLAHVPDKGELETTAAKGNKFEQGRAKMLLAKLAKNGSLEPTYAEYPVQVWKLGDGGPRWVFLGGEVVVDYALRLKHELGAERTWVAGYSNDVMAYIPSRRVLAEGGYEGASSMIYYGLPSPWSPMLEEAIVGAVRKQVGQ